jgi:hypothetical protein
LTAKSRLPSTHDAATAGLANLSKAVNRSTCGTSNANCHAHAGTNASIRIPGNSWLTGSDHAAGRPPAVLRVKMLATEVNVAIRGERLAAAKIESRASPERLEGRVLDEVRRVRRGSGPSRKATVCPAVERGKASADEAAERRAVRYGPEQASATRSSSSCFPQDKLASPKTFLMFR